MSISLDQLNDFHQFAVPHVRAGDVDSLAELARQWEAAREREEVKMALAEAFEDIQAGRYRPAEDVSRDLRKKFNLPE
jgi:oligoribonuclease (3'-5' exoribonuclease)